MRTPFARKPFGGRTGFDAPELLPFCLGNADFRVSPVSVILVAV
jgi:hypothetical protein